VRRRPEPWNAPGYIRDRKAQCQSSESQEQYMRKLTDMGRPKQERERHKDWRVELVTCMIGDPYAWLSAFALADLVTDGRKKRGDLLGWCQRATGIFPSLS
jgi:hypothetical protein